jgi:hypothetical protein
VEAVSKRIFLVFLVSLEKQLVRSAILIEAADQCTVTPRRIKILKTQERVVTDRSLTLQYIYNLNFW